MIRLLAIGRRSAGPALTRSNPLAFQAGAVHAGHGIASWQIMSKRSKSEAAQRVPSSCKKGDAIEGLNIFVNQEPIIAKDDSEYPDWLWTLLDDNSSASKEQLLVGDVLSMEDFAAQKAAIRKQRKAHIKEQNAKKRKK